MMISRVSYRASQFEQGREPIHAVMEASRSWVLLVGDGTRVEYTPELYLKEPAARREAYRWASTLFCDPS